MRGFGLVATEDTRPGQRHHPGGQLAERAAAGDDQDLAGQLDPGDEPAGQLVVAVGLAGGPTAGTGADAEDEQGAPGEVADLRPARSST